MAGSGDRAQNRLRAAERGAEAMFVAVVPSRLVGIASIRWRDGCDPPHPWLYGLHVAADARRRGVGRALVRIVEVESERRGSGHISLDVDIDDAAALSFYESLGYTVVRRHDHRWRSLNPRTGGVMSEGTTATFIMRRPLNTGSTQ